MKTKESKSVGECFELLPLNNEERALDALMAAAFLDGTDLGDEELNVKKLERNLTENDKQALDTLGPDLARKITSGEWETGLERPCDQVANHEVEEDLLVAMNRGDGDNDLSPEARAEIEKKIEESQEQEDEEEEGS